MVNVFGNEIISAFTNGVAVEAIYANGELVWPTSSYYYVKWDSSYYTGTFSMNGNTYNYSDYYPSNKFSSPDFSGTITLMAFISGPFSYIETNAVSIGKWAFVECESLSSVNLPVCSYVDVGAFLECSSLTTASLPVCEHIGNITFAECYSLVSISLPMCEYIGHQAFLDCSSLSQVNLPVCSYVGSNAFDYCYSLSLLTLGSDSVVTIDSSVDTFYRTPFANCQGSILVPYSLVDVYKSAPGWSSLSCVIRPMSSYYINWLPTNVSTDFHIDGVSYNTTYFGGSFYWNGGIITSSAFDATYSGQENASYITYIETNAYSIERKAFYHCRSLKSAYLSQCEYMDDYAFNGCWSLSDVSLPVCKSVPYQTFISCSSLSQISLPECRFVGNMAFAKLQNLKKVDLPKCITIDFDAFGECTSLTQISLPVCTYISNYAFQGCTNLSSIDLPRVSIIRQGGFENCKKLSTLILRYRGVVSLQNHALDGTPFANGRGHIYVPSNHLYTYKTLWSSYASIIFPIPT